MSAPSPLNSKRPLGVTVLTMLQIVGGVSDILVGIVLVLGSSFFDVRVGGGFLATGFLVLALVAFGLGILSLALAYGFWSGRNWAWTFSMVSALLGLIVSGAELIASGLTVDSLANVFAIVLYALILLYLNTHEVRAFFHRSAGYIGLMGSNIPTSPIPYSTQPQYDAPTPNPGYSPRQDQVNSSVMRQVAFCRNCGRAVAPNANFCDACGTLLR